MVSLVGIDGGKVGRRSDAGYVSVAAGVQANVITRIVCTATQVGGVDQVIACGVQLGDKGIIPPWYL